MNSMSSSLVLEERQLRRKAGLFLDVELLPNVIVSIASKNL